MLYNSGPPPVSRNVLGTLKHYPTPLCPYTLSLSHHLTQRPRSVIDGGKNHNRKPTLSDKTQDARAINCMAGRNYRNAFYPPLSARFYSRRTKIVAAAPMYVHIDTNLTMHNQPSCAVDSDRFYRTTCKIVHTHPPWACFRADFVRNIKGGGGGRVRTSKMVALKKIPPRFFNNRSVARRLHVI